MDWDIAYAIGLDPVDGDHQRLFALYGRFSNAVTNGESRAEVGRFLGDLVDYSETHFRREEGIMRQHAYPDYEKHKRMHDAFATYVRATAAGPEPSDDDVQFLHGYVAIWLCGHILVMDKWFGEWLAKVPAETAEGQPIS